MTEPTPKPSAKRRPIGLLGVALLVPAVLLGAWYIDSLPGEPYVPPPSLQPKRPPAPAIAPARIAALESRLEVVEKTQAEILASLAQQPAQSDILVPQTDGAGVDITALLHEIERLQADLEALKAKPPTVQEVIQAPPPVKDSLLVKLYKLEKLARSGQAFDESLEDLLEHPELPQAAHLKLHGLQKAARRGIASTRQLETLFDEAMQAYMSGGTLSEPDDASAWEQIQHNLGSLVTIRKQGSVEDEGDAAHLARAQAAFAEEDLTTVVEELSQLSVEVKKFFEPTLSKARRHVRILQTIERSRDLLDEQPADTSPPLSPGNV